MLDIKNLVITYETNIAVDHVNLQIESGRITGIIGANGAGKSSLIKACAGLLPDMEGSIYFDSKELSANRFFVRKSCGYAPEDVELMPYLKGREFLQLIASIRAIKDPETEIEFLEEMFGITEVQEDLIINFSHGMKQKISIAAALIGRPEYLFFDEALNGLDALSMQRLKDHFNSLKKAGHTIILSSHIISLIRDWCDPVIVMHQGKVIQNLSQQEIISLEEKGKKKLEQLFVEWIRK